MCWSVKGLKAVLMDRAGSSMTMRLVRLKPQGPGPIGARTAQYNENLQSRTLWAPKFIEKKFVVF